MSTELNVDIAALVGEMEALECEHSQHGMPGLAHDDGRATHYVASRCDCGYEPSVRPVCAAYISLITANGPMYCHGCSRDGTASDFITILGPVGATK